MSFGWSATDIANLVQLAWRTYQGAQRACGAYADLTNETQSLHIVLNRLEKESKDPRSLINRPGDTSREEIGTVASGCEKVLGYLDKVLKKYNALSEEERSVRRLYQKVRFGSEEMSLKDLRDKTTSYTSKLSFYLNLVSMGSMGRVERKMEHAGKDLRSLKGAVNKIAAHLLNGAHSEGSVLSSYSDDDKTVWKEFRRNLIKQGFISEQLRKYGPLIQDYLGELSERGVFDDKSDIIVGASCEALAGDSAKGLDVSNKDETPHIATLAIFEAFSRDSANDLDASKQENSWLVRIKGDLEIVRSTMEELIARSSFPRFKGIEDSRFVPKDQASTDASILRDDLLSQNPVLVWNSSHHEHWTWAVRRIWDSRPAKERHEYGLLSGCYFVAST